MESTPIFNSNADPRQMAWLLMSGRIVASSVYYVTKNGIPEILGDRLMTVDEILSKCSSPINKDALQRNLKMLASIGFFREDSEKVAFANTPASLLFSPNTKDTLYNMDTFYGDVLHKTWDGYLECANTGEPAFPKVFGSDVFGYCKSNPSAMQSFNRAMGDLSSAVGRACLDEYYFGNYKKIYDIGGGHGLLVKNILMTYPDVQGLIFDTEKTVEEAKKMSADDHHFTSGRYSFQAGDFFQSVPEGGDCYILKSILHDWKEDKALQILQNCSNAMKSGATLLIIEIVLDKNEPNFVGHCLDLEMLAITGGRERSKEEFKDLLERTGFELKHIVPTKTEYSIVQAVKI